MRNKMESSRIWKSIRDKTTLHPYNLMVLPLSRLIENNHFRYRGRLAGNAYNPSFNVRRGSNESK